MSEALPTDPASGVGDGDGSNESNTVRDDGLPKTFDVLIVGTGLVESIVSAAVSRGGHSVLHIDPGEYYGGTWATFGFDQWMSESLTELPSGVNVDIKTTVNEDKGSVRWENPVKSFQQKWYCEDDSVKANLMKQQRRFNIDVMPKLIAAREEIVELLIKSNVSRYLEFLRVSRLLTNLPPPKETVIEPIPLSRSDIFTSKSLTLVEKRGLVKLIEAVMKSQGSEEPENAAAQEGEGAQKLPDTFEDIVKANKVSEKIKHLITSSVTVLEDGFSPDGEIFNHEFVSRCQLFLSSIGRYGNQTPFLWTLYGISEICQAFCRLSAVYGGIFILKRYLSQISSTEDGYEITTDQDKIKVKHVVAGPNMKLDMFGKDKSKKSQACAVVGRAVLITSGGNIKAPEDSKVKGDGIYLYRISGLEVIEMNHTSQAVPKDYRLIQISFPILEAEPEESHCRKLVEDKLSSFVNFAWSPESSDNPEGADGDSPPDAPTSPAPAVTSKPQVIYGSYFTVSFPSENNAHEVLTSSGSEDSLRFIIGSSVSSTDLNNYVSKARDIYARLYPDEEFLPKAPDSEEQDTANGEPEDDEPANNVHQVPVEAEISAPDADTGDRASEQVENA